MKRWKSIWRYEGYLALLSRDNQTRTSNTKFRFFRQLWILGRGHLRSKDQAANQRHLLARNGKIDNFWMDRIAKE